MFGAHLIHYKITYAGWRSGGDGGVGNGAGVLGGISATKSKFTVVGSCSTAADGGKVDTQNLGANQSFRVSIVNNGGNFTS
jgi:hypothetical protein